MEFEEKSVWPRNSKRGYSRDGRVVMIYRVTNEVKGVCETKRDVVVSGYFKLPTPMAAEQLMEDLFYGEYDGA